MNMSDEEAFELARTVQSVAVIGMTDGSKPGRASFEIPEMMAARGIKITPINPMIETALGQKSLASPEQMTSVPDIYNVFRRPDAIPEIAKELLELPAEHHKAVVWLQSGISHEEAEEALQQGGYKVVSDRCLGVFVARTGRPVVS